MISPLYQHALQLGADKHWLNPSNQGQSRLSVYYGKPLRGVARLIYGLACTTLISTIGTLFHAAKSIDGAMMTTSHTETTCMKTRAWEYLIAAKQDSLMALTMATLAFVATKIFTFTQTLSFSDQFKMGLSLVFLAREAAFITPLHFALAPDAFKLEVNKT